MLLHCFPSSLQKEEVLNETQSSMKGGFPPSYVSRCLANKEKNGSRLWDAETAGQSKSEDENIGIGKKRI